MTDAEIAGMMGWRGPGAYTAASLRKIRAIVEKVQSEAKKDALDAARYRILFEFGDFNLCRAPYWPIIGWMRDGDDVKKEDVDMALDHFIEAGKKEK